MHRQFDDSNPHFHPPLNNVDPTIEFTTQLPPARRSRSRSRSRPVEEHSQPPFIPHPRAHHEYPPHHYSTSPDSRHQSRTPPPPPPPPQTQPHHQSRSPHFVPQPDQTHQEPRQQPHFAHQGDHPHHESRKNPHFAPVPDQPHHGSLQPSGPPSPGTGHGHDHPSPLHSGRRHRRNDLQMPESKKTNPLAWLLAAFCVLFWILVIIGGLVILIVYLVFRPRNPRFDISTATLNAAYLDMGYLLNADVTVLANFTNPNTKVNIDFTYIVLDIYYEKRFVATRYIDPFSVMRRESRFADVHMVASQVALSTGHSLELQRQIAAGRVKFEIRGLFKTRSRFGGIFQYSYWLYAHCQLVVAGPPTGVLIGKKCVTKQ